MRQEKLETIDILLVDGSPTDRLLAAEALAEAKVANNLHTVEDGVEAMSFLRRQGKYKDVIRPDLILLDLNLPIKDGREVLAEIKADPILRFIPVAILTTSKAEEDIVKAHGLHANCYIAKPVDFLQFAEVVSAIENFWFAVVTLPTEAAVQRAARALAPRSLPPPEVADGRILRVLLLEDDPTDATMAREALDKAKAVKFVVTHVERLAAARERLNLEKFDLVLTDLNLPDSRGLETYRQVRQAAPGLPVIVLTGSDDESIGLSVLHEGAQDFLSKRDVSGQSLIRAARYAIERKRLEDQLRRSQRREAVGQLAGGVAHDFNNNLTVITGHCHLLLAALPPEGAATESVREIGQAAARAANLTRQLLTFSSSQAMQTEPVELNEAVGNITKMLRRILGEDIRLELHLAAALPMIVADVGMLEQIIMNLAVNARDAMPGGGKITLQTAAVRVDHLVAKRNPDAHAGSFVCLKVSDTGCGIPPENLPHVFEPFFTTKDVGKGTGLGLATVYGVSKQHGGWVEVNSAVGLGTTFRIFLPAAPGVAKPEKPPGETTPRGGTETILFVEDEAPVRALGKMILEKNGYHVLEAGSGATALRLWAEQAARIDLLFTDMVMPDGMTGRKLAECLQGQRPGLNVLFTSGYSRDFVSPDFKLKEGVNFLQKPYSVEGLLHGVRNCLDSALRPPEAG